jgi:uncharacterized protein
MFETSTYQALAGGIMIGVAASLLIVLSGRIAGISGILSGAIFSKDDRSWRILFIGGLLIGGLLCHALTGKPVPEIAVTNPWMAVLGGLIVGYGVRLGSGCTSGHGVCGIARFSRRSIVATLCFIGAGVATVALKSFLIGGA